MVSDMERSASIKDAPLAEGKKFVVDSKEHRTIVRAVPEINASFEEQVFNSLVLLKVSISQYAMHLSTEERHRLFKELDGLINVEHWHEGDTLPSIIAFRDFLKWMIYSKYFKWISLGVSDDGGMLVAWKTPRVLLTAKFSGLAGQEGVRWTAEMTSAKGETGYAVGKCPLRLFAEQAMFFLGGAENEAEQHSG
jgi:hypothetical protein